MSTTAAGLDPAHPQEIAIPGTHESVMRFVRRVATPAPGARTLDIGAGEGSLSKRLADAGFDVSACDLDPGLFKARGITCRPVDATGALPYDDEAFDLVLCVEVVEHLESHRPLFSEIRRVLRPDGRLIFTTPNILSFKSRVTFLLSGYYYSFGPLDPAELNPVVQHISPFTLDRYRWVMRRCGLEIVEVATDKLQLSSGFLAGLWPLAKLYGPIRWGRSKNLRRQNAATLLFGRTMFISARRCSGGGEWLGKP